MDNTTFVQENEQNITGTIANALQVNVTDVVIAVSLKRAVQAQGSVTVTVTNGAYAVAQFFDNPATLKDALSGVGVTVNSFQGSVLSSKCQLLCQSYRSHSKQSAGETTPVFDAVANSGTPVDTPVNSPVSTPGTTSPLSASPLGDGGKLLHVHSKSAKINFFHSYCTPWSS